MDNSADASKLGVDAVDAAVVDRRRPRFAGLDGIRGLAALFVVFHHCWLMSFPGFPADNGPAWAGFLLYGHLAVVVFIVLSGFSLGIGPARGGWHVDNLGKYAHRRAWRILPPYWAALAFSLIIALTLVPQPGEGMPTAKSVLVYGTLTQDVVGAPSPNGAFWSIAVEAQLYIALPIMLILLRRAGAIVLLAAVTLPVLLIGIFAPSVAAADLFIRFTPQFLVAFTVGMLAAATVNGKHRQRPWHWYALAAAVPGIALDRDHGLGVDRQPLLLGRSAAGSRGRAADQRRGGSGPASTVRGTAGLAAGAQPRWVLLFPVSRARADRDRGGHTDRRPPVRARHRSVPGDRGDRRAAVVDLRPAVRGGLRPSVPTAQVVGVTGRGGEGDLPAARRWRSGSGSRSGGSRPGGGGSFDF